jgi:hypothetical protein
MYGDVSFVGSMIHSQSAFKPFFSELILCSIFLCLLLQLHGWQASVQPSFAKKVIFTFSSQVTHFSLSYKIIEQNIIWYFYNKLKSVGF